MNNAFLCCLELSKDSSSADDGVLESRSKSASLVLGYCGDVGKMDKKSIPVEGLSIRHRKVCVKITCRPGSTKQSLLQLLK
jgi:hypothetical protein